jgi:hypothetical protein
MKKNKPLTEAQFVGLSKDLAALPKKKVYTAEATIEALYDDITKALENGYTNGEIIEKLKEHGLAIQESSFKSYLRNAKAKREKTPTTQN